MQFFNPGKPDINKKLNLFSLLVDKLAFWFYFFSGKHQAVKSSMTACDIIAERNFLGVMSVSF